MGIFNFWARKKAEWDSRSLYEMLDSEKYARRPYNRSDHKEGMSVIEQLRGEYWKPRYLMDDRNKTAVEFMSENARLLTVRMDDIDWESLNHLPGDVISVARDLDAHFPTIVHYYQNGAAMVRWELNPDGRYYMDDDGYGMTDDEEISLYGQIDRMGRVIEKFHFKP